MSRILLLIIGTLFLLSCNKEKESIDFYKKAINSLPKQYETFTYDSLKSKDLSQIFNYLNKSLKLNPKNHKARHTKFILQFQTAQYKKALLTFDNAIKHDIIDTLKLATSFFHQVAVTNEILGNYSISNQLYTQAIKKYEIQIYNEPHYLPAISNKAFLLCQIN